MTCTLNLKRMESKVLDRFGNCSSKSSSGSETLSEGEMKAIGSSSVSGHIDYLSQNSSDSETRTEITSEEKRDAEDRTEERETGTEDPRDYAEEDEDELVKRLLLGYSFTIPLLQQPLNAGTV